MCGFFNSLLGQEGVIYCISLVSHPWTVVLVVQVDIMSEALVGGYSCQEHVCESLPGKRGECLH